MSGQPGSPPLELRGIDKSFPGVQAVREATFTCAAGEVHALVGENGAGKSTLMAIASGNLIPERGEVAICGQSATGASPGQTAALGLSVIYQDDSLVPDLSVAQNLALGLPVTKRPEPRRLRGWAEGELATLAAGVRADAYVWELGVGDRHLVEITKALVANPMVLVLDEPTAPLTADEVTRLFEILRTRANLGTAVVYITHRLGEVFELAERVSVMRGGRMVEHRLPTAETDEDDLIRLMVGQPLKSVFPDRPGSLDGTAGPVLSVSGLSGQIVSDVDFQVAAGEIVGLAGIQGNGQREVARALVGLERRDGTIRVKGEEVPAGNVAAARRSGLEYVTSERRDEGLFMGLSVRENVALGSLGRLSRGGWLPPAEERSTVAAQCRALDVRTPGLEQTVALLSGGNQQKVSLGRAFMSEPSLFVVDEPTQGVDPGARVEIYSHLREAAGSSSGAAVVVVSSDAVELAGLCDRVLVFARGRIVRELTGDDLSEEAIVGAAVTDREHGSRVEALAGGSRFARLRSSDATPVGLLLLAFILLMVGFAVARPLFLGEANVANLLFLIVPLGFVALGQACVMLIGGIDLSVGPLVALTTVAIAKLLEEGGGPANSALAIAVALAIGVAVGVINGVLVRRWNLVPLIATLATYVLIQGIALLWLPVTGGYVSEGFMTTASALVGVVPIAFIGLVVVALALEYLYRRSAVGLAFRAVGSRERAAFRSGVPVGWVHYGAYALCGLLAAVGGLFFTATIGIGDPALGTTFTLSSIAAVVLGGLSTWGGRGSFVGPLCGAAVLSLVANGFSFLGLAPHLELLAQGTLILVAIALYSRLRSVGNYRDDVVAAQY